MSGDGDGAAQHHPVPGQYSPQAEALWRPATSTPGPGGAPASGHGDSQQWQAVWRRGARPTGAETGTRGCPRGSRLHAHSRVPRVPPLPGPAGATIAGSQRGEPGVGQDHQQQRARVVARRTAEPGGEAGGLTLQHRSLQTQDSITLQRASEPDAPEGGEYRPVGELVYLDVASVASTWQRCSPLRAQGPISSQRAFLSNPNNMESG